MCGLGRRRVRAPVEHLDLASYPIREDKAEPTVANGDGLGDVGSQANIGAVRSGPSENQSQLPASQAAVDQLERVEADLRAASEFRMKMRRERGHRRTWPRNDKEDEDR